MPHAISSGGAEAESSVVLSLRELAEMEERRVETAAQHAALEQARRAEHEREAQKAREVLAEQAARERVEREERDRKEAAQADALKHAAAERARTEVLVRAEAERRELDRRRNVEARGRHRRALGQGVLAGAMAALSVAGGIYAGAIAPLERATAARARDAASSCGESLRVLGIRVASSEERLRVADGDLETAARERDRLRSEVESMTREVGRKNAPKPVGAPSLTPRRPVEYFLKCPPGSHDPMCVQ